MDERRRMLERLRDLDRALVEISPGSSVLREIISRERDGIIEALTMRVTSEVKTK